MTIVYEQVRLSFHDIHGRGVSPTRLVSGTTSAIDLCCGMGGISLAAKQLGITIVAGVDVNSSALKTFEKGFPNAETIVGSVSSEAIIKQCMDLLPTNIGNENKLVILSGPPCQGFSAAGSRKPEDPRNEVFVAVARAITKIQPDCALVENVPAVLARKNIAQLDAFGNILRDGGYCSLSITVDASEFGLAQIRRRTFFLITRQALCEQEVHERIEMLKSPGKTVAEVLAGLPTPTIRPDECDDEADHGEWLNHLAMRHSKAVMEKIAAIDPGTGPMSYRRLHPERQANTLFSGHRAPPAHFSEPRSITVREAARLQGFPDSFRIYGPFASQMEQVTNSVPLPLSLAVLRVLAEFVGLPVPCHD